MHHQCNNPEQRVDDADPDQPPHRRKTRPGHAQDQQRDFVLDDSTAVHRARPRRAGRSGNVSHQGPSRGTAPRRRQPCGPDPRPPTRRASANRTTLNSPLCRAIARTPLAHARRGRAHAGPSSAPHWPTPGVAAPTARTARSGYVPEPHSPRARLSQRADSPRPRQRPPPQAEPSSGRCPSG